MTDNSDGFFVRHSPDGLPAEEVSKVLNQKMDETESPVEGQCTAGSKEVDGWNIMQTG